MESILFVDDEPAVLDGYKRLLYREFSVHTSVGGPAGLVALRDHGPFAVVVSDMRMPGMNGAEFLSKAMTLAPHTVRMLLTGYSDVLDTAAAVNEGNISRYLNKPCPKEEMIAALKTGVEQYRLAKAEQELLQSTLLGSIRALSEVMSAISPGAFERAARVSNTVRHLLQHTVVVAPWRAEAAAMLSQLGCLAMTPELLHAAHRGKTLPEEDKARFDAHPRHASDLVVHIPRMEEIGWIIQRQIYSPTSAPPVSASAQDADQLILAGEMLRLAVDYDTLWLNGTNHASTVFALRKAVHTFPASLLDALETMKPVEQVMKPAKLPVSQLEVDMVLNEEVRNSAGALLLGGDQPITKAMLLKLREYAEDRRIHGEISVLIPSA